jgi:hypothetical protein
MKQISLLHISFLLILCPSLRAQDVLTFKNGNDLQVKVQEITPQEVKYKRFDNLNGPVITILRNSAKAVKYENGTIENLSEDIEQTAIPVVEKSGYEAGDIVSLIYIDKKYEGEIYEINDRKGTAIVKFDNGRKTANRDLNELLLVRHKSATELSNQPGASQANSAGQQNQPIYSLDDQGYTKMYKKGEVDATRYYRGYTGAGTGTFVTSFLVGPLLGLIPAIACSSTTPKRRNLGLPNTQIAENNDYYQGYAQQAKRIKSKKVWTNYGIGVGILLLLVVVTSGGQ